MEQVGQSSGFALSGRKTWLYCGRHCIALTSLDSNFYCYCYFAHDVLPVCLLDKLIAAYL
jgi:hypothetical protein